MHATAQLSELSYEPGFSQWTFQKIDSAFQAALAHDAPSHATGKRFRQYPGVATTPEEKFYAPSQTVGVEFVLSEITNAPEPCRYIWS